MPDQRLLGLWRLIRTLNTVSSSIDMFGKIEAVATALAASAAIYAGWYAKRAFEHQRDQLERAMKLDALQTEAIKAQLSEMQAGRLERQSQRVEQLRGQARRVHIGNLTHGEALYWTHNADDGTEIRHYTAEFTCRLANDSRATIHGVHARYMRADGSEVSNRIQSPAKHASIASSQHVTLVSNSTEVDPPPVLWVEFTDDNGVRWRMNSDGVMEFDSGGVFDDLAAPDAHGWTRVERHGAIGARPAGQ